MAKSEIISQVDVLVPGHQYKIMIMRNGLHDAALLQSLVPSQQVLIVTNKTIAPLYLSQLKTVFDYKQCDTVILPDGEEYKNQNALNSIYNALIENKHHRDTTIIALGGGVIGDISGFAAATYQRGVRFIQIPTTLLAQVDASVGGKTAINHALGKNLIGSFYQPHAVIIDINTLSTLPEREFKAGLAEIIKYGLLVGGDFLTQLQLALSNGLQADSPELPQIIEQCCRIKADIVAVDEREQGSRALLNLGHTFAHALEAQTKYQHWLHGEAVAIGLYCALQLSAELGLHDGSLTQETADMLRNAGLEYKIPKSIDLNQLQELMNLDKKVKDSKLRFVVIKKPGECYLEQGVTASCLQKTLHAVVEGD